MFATLVSDNLKHRKTVEGFLSKETHDLKASVPKVALQKHKSSVFTDTLINGCVQSYADLFFLDNITQLSTPELEVFSSVLCASEKRLAALENDSAIRGYENVAEMIAPDVSPSAKLYFATKCLDIATTFKSQIEMDRANMRIGALHEEQGNLETALQFYENAESSRGAPEKLIDIMSLLAVKNPQQASDLYQRALSYAMAKAPAKLIDARQRLGNYLLDKDDFDAAIEQHNLELEQCMSCKDPRQVRARLSLADTYQAKGDLAAAIDQHQASLEYIKNAEQNDRLAESNIKMKLGLIYLEKSLETSNKEYSEKSIHLLQEHYVLEESLGDRDRITEASILLGMSRAAGMFPEYWEATNDLPKMLRWKSSRSLNLN